MPLVLYVQGANDIVHPKIDLERFVASYRKRGGEVDLALFEGEGEGFIRNPSSKARSARHAARHRYRARASWLRRKARSRAACEFVWSRAPTACP